MIGLCYAASNTRRSHTRASKLNGFHGAMLDDAFRASAILHDREMGVQGTVSEPNHVRPEDAVQTALPELGSGGKLTTLRGTQRKYYVQDSYRTMSIRNSASALTAKQ